MRKEDYLAHYGVKGMKWGVRRYQPYPSGSRSRREKLTGHNINGAAVRAAMKRNASTNASSVKSSVDKSFTRSIKTSKGTRIAPAEQAVSNAQKINNEALNLTRHASDVRRRSARKDVSNMTDAELKAAVNRMNLERQYHTLTAENTRTGFEKAQDILQTSGAVIGIASGVIGIAVGIHELKKK